MRRTVFVLLPVAIFTMASTSLAATWHVPAQAPTIQAGIDLASAGDTVLVACGTYYEHDIEMKSGVTLLSEDGDADCVTIDAGEEGRVIYCDAVDASATIEGFTFTGGVASGAYPDYAGAGMICLNASNPSITRCVFAENTADTGGGLFCDSSSPMVTYCLFLGNVSTRFDGGALLCYGSSAPTFVNCTFCENWAVRGTVLRSCDTSSPTIESSILAFNEYGYPVHCTETSSVTLSCCDVFGNIGGDWESCIADQYGLRWNFSSNPLFCHDYSVSEYSPCSPDYSPAGCGPIGSEGVGCHYQSVESSGEADPGGLYLGPAVPNPFNPTAEIHYRIPAGFPPAPVRMHVFDATGREVTTLVDTEQGPGIYGVFWDGTDQGGAPVASGVYFYRLSWNGKSETRRMVLLK